MANHEDLGLAHATLSLAELGILPDRLGPDAGGARRFRGVSTLERGGADDLAVFVAGDDPDDLAFTRVGGCFVARENLALVPDGTMAIITADPFAAFARAAGRFAALGGGRPMPSVGVHPSATVAADVVMEAGVAIASGAVVETGVQIGAGTVIGAHSVIGAGVSIGRRCTIEDHVSVRHALIGDRVRIRAGARLGLEAVRGGECAPIGRLIVQDGVQIGANAAIECGLLRDTVIGEAAWVGALAAVPADTLVDRFESFGTTAELVGAAKMV